MYKSYFKRSPSVKFKLGLDKRLVSDKYSAVPL